MIGKQTDNLGTCKETNRKMGNIKGNPREIKGQWKGNEETYKGTSKEHEGKCKEGKRTMTGHMGKWSGKLFFAFFPKRDEVQGKSWFCFCEIEQKRVTHNVFLIYPPRKSNFCCIYPKTCLSPGEEVSCQARSDQGYYQIHCVLSRTSTAYFSTCLQQLSRT